jgi:hypothetical protein
MWASNLFLRNVFVEDFLPGQGDDDLVAALEKRFSQPPRHEDTKFPALLGALVVNDFPGRCKRRAGVWP